MPELTSFIEARLRSAASIAMDHYGQPLEGWVREGEPTQEVTIADLAIGHLVVGDIRSAYPGDNIIDEETGVIDNGSRYTWVLDDVDGTTNYKRGLPQFGHMLAVMDGGKPIAAGILLPGLQTPEMYTAEKGGGAYCNGERLRVSNTAKLADVLVAYGIDVYPDDPANTLREFEMMARIGMKATSVRCNNSIYDVCQVAKGGYGASLTRTDRLWDCVAAELILTEAGAKYTSFEGTPNDYSNPTRKFDIMFSRCVAAPAIHEEIQSIIHA